LKEQVDPKLYGIPPRTVLMKRDSKEFILVIKRKIRIIMKDALAIVEKAKKIKEKVPKASIFLETTAPVCSKSIKFLNDNDVEVLKCS